MPAPQNHWAALVGANNDPVTGSPVYTGRGVYAHFQGGMGHAYGRKHPFGHTGEFPRLIGEVAEDILTQDEWGVAYPAGTLWVRTNAWAAWFPVPSVLPAGFTYVPDRNINPIWGINGQQNFGSWTTLFPYTTPLVHGNPIAGLQPEYGRGQSPSFQATYLTLADAIVDIPMTTTVLNSAAQLVEFNQGPYAESSSSSPPRQLSTTTSTSPNPLYSPLHPGFRASSLRLFANANAPWNWNPTLWGPTDQISVTFEGVTYIADKTNLVLNGATNIWEVTFNPGATAQAAAGVLTYLTIQSELNGPFFAVGTHQQIGYDLKLSPRVDLPLPFSCTTGNLHAPGGVVTGSVAGYPRTPA